MSHSALVLLEIGGVLFALAMMARVAGYLGLSPIPLYLLTGLALGRGGLVPLVTSEQFIDVGAEIGVVLLLLMLGLEYSSEELVGSLRSGGVAGGADLVANFVPGYAIGLILGFGPIGSLYLGGVTYISSSGVVAKLIADLGWTANRETPVVISVLVFEDLAMAVLLPILGALAVGGSAAGVLGSVMLAVSAVVLVLAIATKQGNRLSELAFSSTNEVNLLTLLGVSLLVAGIAEQINVSAAVGAFLVGIGVSGEKAHMARELLSPLRDLFAGVFFVFFGLSTDPAALPGVMGGVLALVVVTGATKAASSWWAARRAGVGIEGRKRTAALLLARGEFSIIIAGLGVTAGFGPDLAATAAGYVLAMATLGPIATRWVDRRPAAA